MKNKKPYLIAEIGVNYYDTAKVMNITPLEAAKLYIMKTKKNGKQRFLTDRKPLETNKNL